MSELSDRESALLAACDTAAWALMVGFIGKDIDHETRSFFSRTRQGLERALKAYEDDPR